MMFHSFSIYKTVYLVDDWENASQDSSSEQLKDGLIFEPERRQYLWSDSMLDQQIKAGQALVVLARSNSFTPHYANVQVLHYRNYDVYFLILSVQYKIRPSLHLQAFPNPMSEITFISCLLKNKPSCPKFLSVWQVIFKIIVVPCIG
jgi:hypothetical protein